jgi:hypothetical protein
METLGTIRCRVQLAVADRATNVGGLPTLVALENTQTQRDTQKKKKTMRMMRGIAGAMIHRVATVVAAVVGCVTDVGAF